MVYSDLRPADTPDADRRKQKSFFAPNVAKNSSNRAVKFSKTSLVLSTVHMYPRSASGVRN